MAITPTEIVQHAVDRVTLGMPAADAIRAEAERTGAQRIFLVAGGHLASQTDEIDRIVAALGARETLVHTGIRAHAPMDDIVEATGLATDFRPDLYVGVGGGSVTDATKIIGLAVAMGVRNRADLMAARHAEMSKRSAGSPEAPPRERKVVLVPITLSAGEYHIFAGAMNEESRHKQAFADHCTVPRMVVLDPAITLHTPEWLWLSTGCRAVDHAVETLVSDHSNPFANGLAESALKLLARGLAAVKAAPEDLSARLDCQVGAWQASIPLTTGVPMGASHAIGHALGGLGVAHGHTSCVMMPYVQQWNASHTAVRQARISDGLGQPGVPAHQALDALVRELGLPRTLGEVGVDRSQFDEIARIALHDLYAPTNPRPFDRAEHVREILEMALG